MRTSFKSLLFLFVALVMTGMFSACSEGEDLPNGGKPMVNYIRVTRPAASDSLITKAGQGAMIAIVGENLGNARELWINDQQASLSPTLITNNSIITRVPSNIPTEITNKMKIIFANGEELVHDFTVDISEPRIDRMLSEYVNSGDVATIVGDFFYEPLKVTFTGGAEGEIVSIKDNKTLEVRVPEGAQPGPITVTSNFGATESDFWFRDNRNIIAAFEDTNFDGWWHGKDFVVSSDPEIPAISGKFLRSNKDLGAWAWYEMWVGNGGTIKTGTSNIPADAFANPGKYSLKFELNTLQSLQGAELHMYMGANMASEREKINYNWKPNIDTKGEWQTVIIPWEDFLKGNTTLKYNPAGYEVSFHFSGASPVKAMFGLDNIRVVPN
ncbi:glycan-binding surface protein [Rufibacter latericius]|uniref:Surface glycan-binding protein B xyloglucan binding domain-containing protein n=1 Tax=Rufibacter latericius TaxID=2487040 RepID=A0A3M9N1J6_9BACT|nr:glycan-binding surface protein [Rufibacter latericius]RNI31265.1 hypothetical protein EFB08_01680 [Rufibacter latericius]